jgi:predicted ATP-grasp superfamily ATP-dependent carboligase
MASPVTGHLPTQHSRRVGSASVDILLLDAECRQTLACLRVYARAGLRAGAVACESEAWWAPSLQSERCSLRAVVPDYTSDADGYVDALLAVLEQSSARLLVPAHDGSIEALRGRRTELERRVALPLASEAALAIAVSKAKTLALAAEIGIAIPRSVPTSAPDDVPTALGEVGLPAVIKPERSWVELDGGGLRLSSEAVSTVDEAKRSVEGMLSVGGRALIQQWLPGRREAVSLFYARDRFWARLAQVSHREWPVLGGVSVLCETIPLLPDITEQSERLVRAIDLEGCSMVEFRRDEAGRPVLMEVNPRMGGSVGLAISAGVDFPMLLHDWGLGRPLTEVTTYRVGQRLRWLVGDIWNLKGVFDGQGRPDVPSSADALARFLLDFVRPANALDVLEISDMRPGLSEMNKFVWRHATRRARRLPVVKWLTSFGR